MPKTFRFVLGTFQKYSGQISRLFRNVPILSHFLSYLEQFDDETRTISLSLKT